MNAKNIANGKTLRQVKNSKDRMKLQMEIAIKRNIESLIHEYADKSSDGYSLDVSEISTHDQESLVDFLFEKDETFNEIALDYIQQLIDERIDLVYAKDQYDKDLLPIHDSQTGEVQWIFKGV